MSRYREPVGPAGVAGPEQRAPRVGDLDPRLLVPSGRTVLAQIAAEHDVPAVASRCLSCRWPVGGGQRVCPSRALARCVRERKPVPAWLVHLVDAVPGAIAPRAKTDPATRAAAEDALPGLFDAPERSEPQPPRTTSGQTTSPQTTRTSSRNGATR